MQQLFGCFVLAVAANSMLQKNMSREIAIAAAASCNSAVLVH